MSYYTDLDNDLSYEREALAREAEQRKGAILGIKAKLLKLPNDKLLDFVLKQGERMNRPGMAFKLYAVCKRLRDNEWSPTFKQWMAILNTAAIAAYEDGVSLEGVEGGGGE
jgi:hypothetical protein